MNIIVKKKPCKCIYDSVRIQRTDFPVLTCATRVVDGKALGSVGARPVHAVVYDVNLEDGIDVIADDIMAKVQTKTNGRASAEYRKRMTKVLVKRCLKEMEAF